MKKKKNLAVMRRIKTLTGQIEKLRGDIALLEFELASLTSTCLDVPVQWSKIPSRVADAVKELLGRAESITYRDLIAFSPRQLMTVHNMGRTSVLALEEHLAELELELRPDPGSRGPR